jgi:hypothetical protein
LSTYLFIFVVIKWHCRSWDYVASDVC